MKILLIEDDKVLNQTIAEYLTIKNFKVTSSYDGEDVLDVIDNQEFDLYIIDIFLPNINGLDLVRHIKEKSMNAPAVIITGSDDISHLEKAFFYGCDEFIKKPFHLKELEIRIYRILNITHIVNIKDDLVFNLKNLELIYKQKEVVLRKKEKLLLNILVTNMGSIVLKDDIVDYVWEGDDKDDYPLRQLVSNLREKLPYDIIKTEIGMGYKIH